MPSMFRNWFGGSNNSSSSKTHARSKSTPPNIYAAPGTTTGVPPRPEAQRTYSYSASHSTTPSPLRFATNTAPSDTRTTYGYGRRGSSSSHTEDLRPQVLRRASNKPKSHGKFYARLCFCLGPVLICHTLIAPIYTPSAGQFTPTSSRSNSNSSMFTSMGAAPYSTSRSDSGHHHVLYSDTRPPLTSNYSWQTAGSVGSMSSCESRSTDPRVSS